MALEGGEGSGSRPGRPLHQENTRYPELVWLGVEILAPQRESIPGPSSPLTFAISTTLPGPRYDRKLSVTFVKCKANSAEALPVRPSKGPSANSTTPQFAEGINLLDLAAQVSKLLISIQPKFTPSYNRTAVRHTRP